jgi:rubrerythrin
MICPWCSIRFMNADDSDECPVCNRVVGGGTPA